MAFWRLVFDWSQPWLSTHKEISRQSQYNFNENSLGNNIIITKITVDRLFLKYLLPIGSSTNGYGFLDLQLSQLY